LNSDTDSNRLWRGRIAIFLFATLVIGLLWFNFQSAKEVNREKLEHESITASIELENKKLERLDFLESRHKRLEAEHAIITESLQALYE